MFKRNKKSEKGFTLIELLIVISIIGFLSSVVLASMKTAREKAMDSKIAQDLRQFGIAQQLYFDTNGVYALGDVDTSVFAKQENNSFSNNDFNIFSIKVVHAYSYTDQNCNTFRTSAGKLVASKYLSAVPKHPKDNMTNICYKAASTTANFTAYAPLVTSTKNVGVILGETNLANLQSLYSATEGQYPRNSAFNGQITDLASAGDAILATTGGSSTGNSHGTTLIGTKNFGEYCSSRTECISGYCGYDEETQSPACSDGTPARLCDSDEQCISNSCDLASYRCD